MSRFGYLTDKIRQAEFSLSPYKHIYIENFFSESDFAHLTGSPEINIRQVKTDEELIDALYEQRYKEISFPGTTTDIASYLEWHKSKGANTTPSAGTCAGFGVTMRLQEANHGPVNELREYFAAPDFWVTAQEKFGIDGSKVWSDTGLQKYLDGYEISPHPDIRLKALTFMVNMNPAADSEAINYHTEYMTFKPERQYVCHYWSENREADRCWVPWDWCDVISKQTKNNSIVLFAPSDDTLHAVKASYDHLRTQRTQFYGNLWFNDSTVKHRPTWQDLDAMRKAPHESIPAPG